MLTSTIRCNNCNNATLHKTTVRKGDLASLSTAQKILYNTIKNNYYIDYYRCFFCGNRWETEEYKKGKE